MSTKPGRDLGLAPEKPTKKFVQLPDTGKDNKQERANRLLSSKLPFRVQQLMRLWIKLGFRVGGIKTKQYQKDVKSLTRVLNRSDYIPGQMRRFEANEVAKAMRTFREWLDNPDNLLFRDRSDDLLYKKRLGVSYLADFIFNQIGKTEITKSWLMVCIKGDKPVVGKVVQKGRGIEEQVRQTDEEELWKVAETINKIYATYYERAFPDRRVEIVSPRAIGRSPYYRAAIILTRFMKRHPHLEKTQTGKFREHYMVHVLFSMNEDSWERFHPGWLTTEAMAETLEKYYEENGGYF